MIPERVLTALKTIENSSDYTLVLSYIQNSNVLSEEFKTLKGSGKIKGESIGDLLKEQEDLIKEKETLLKEKETGEKSLQTLESEKTELLNSVAQRDQQIKDTKIEQQKDLFFNGLSSLDREKYEKSYGALLNWDLDENEGLTIQGKPAQEYYNEEIKPLESAFLAKPQPEAPKTQDPNPEAPKYSIFKGVEALPAS